MATARLTVTNPIVQRFKFKPSSLTVQPPQPNSKTNAKAEELKSGQKTEGASVTM